LNAKPTRRLILAITGASGAVYGIRALQLLKSQGVESHLILSDTARQTIETETEWTVAAVEALASVVHNNQNLGAAIASGSFATQGMLIAPCSIKALSGVANSYNADLITRAADVCLKEGRPLVLMVRETPLHLGHLRLMTAAAEMGAVIFPPAPAFYGRPATLEDVITASVGRALARLGLDNSDFPIWRGAAPH
jgi:4-hydroxy-3-polyprenylbenzoate decarboxylase